MRVCDTWRERARASERCWISAFRIEPIQELMVNKDLAWTQTSFDRRLLLMRSVKFSLSELTLFDQSMLHTHGELFLL